MFPVVAALTVGCAQTIKEGYREPVIDRITDSSGSRPEWVRKTPSPDGRIYLVTSFSEGLSAESGTRIAKAYAFAQIAEQLQASVNVNSQLNSQKSRVQIEEKISWQASAIIRSMRQDDLYWERRVTQEGVRYSVWALWSIPEKTFYGLQEEISK